MQLRAGKSPGPERAESEEAESAPVEVLEAEIVRLRSEVKAIQAKHEADTALLQKEIAGLKQTIDQIIELVTKQSLAVEPTTKKQQTKRMPHEPLPVWKEVWPFNQLVHNIDRNDRTFINVVAQVLQAISPNVKNYIADIKGIHGTPSIFAITNKRREIVRLINTSSNAEFEKLVDFERLIE
ncbi:hypothetical protein HK105_208559 [Polyrhizophydium stewartii]|uniref:Transposase n=1 Tax=Polyrhizophydium stewartii TaxID=2732419 RepID=A0ABR4MXF2_9FUNG|nr:hypothetical protein HK105_007151 [Polyrhizophydium stewartii]